MYTVLDLFSGCGGLSLGFEQAGFRIMLGVDNWHDALETFKLNHNSSQTYCTDLSVCNYHLIEKNYLTEGVDVIVGGPPCQGFSISGKRNPKDPRNSLYQSFVSAVKHFKPKVFIMENVPNLASMQNGQIKREIVNEFESLGYFSYYETLLASNYGVPQKRKRVFIFGSRREFSKAHPQVTHCPVDLADELGLESYVNSGSVINRFRFKKYFEPSEIIDNGTYAAELRAVPPGKNYIALTARQNYPNPKFVAGARVWNFLLKLHPEMPSWTIPAQPGPWIGPFHWTSRRLRIPEIAALQTFPDDYRFVGSRRSIQKQIGNAVPVQLANVLGQHFRDILQQ